jgi:hypothetical protein
LLLTILEDFVRIVCRTQISQVDTNLRNITNYTDDLIKNDVSLTGIKEPCVWNQIDSFHVTDNYSVDVMHDMLEGVCNYDIGLMLKRMIFDLKYFSLNTLNNRIELFDYGPIDIRNRPTMISSESLKVKAILKMSASEMLCFVKNLGLMIGDLVPRNSEIWTIHIILDKILNIILSKCITFENSFILENLITEHHETYLKIFRNKNLKPKHHHMVHYPVILRKSGPLPLHWSMRFEGKHKATANSTTSRKNIVKALSLKQQLRLSYRLLSPKIDYYTIPIEIEPAIKLSQLDIDSYNEYSGHYDLNNRDVTFFVSWVKINGLLYNSKSMSVIIKVCDENNDILPLFRFIKSIFIVKNEPFIIYVLYKTIFYDEHFGA